MDIQEKSCTSWRSVLSGLLRVVLKPFLFLLLINAAHGADIDVNKLLQTAKNQNKHILFFHHIPKCPYCKAMLDESFEDGTILKEIDKNYLHVDIYTANKGTVKFRNFTGSYKEFSAHIGAFVYPSTIFMNADGEVVHQAIGYRNIDEYFGEITYVSSENYKTMDLESYKVKLEFEKD
ncbi:MAG: thioredoxin family protein [Marichromatium sp.]|nr:thioredoxin family protein [Marichromatium sp.]